MKHRNPLAVVGLSIITLGIYDLYWLWETKNELNAKTQQRIPSIWLLIVSPIPLIIGYVLFIVADVNLKNNGNGANIGAIGLVGLGLIIIGYLIALAISIVWFFKYSKAVNDYTQGKMSTAVSFLVLFLIHLIGVALIQDAFNDMSGPQLATTTAAGNMPQPIMPPPITGQAPIVTPPSPEGPPIGVPPTIPVAPTAPPAVEPPHEQQPGPPTSPPAG